MKAAGKSTDAPQVRPIASRVKPERLAALRAKLRSKVELREFGGTHSRMARGLLEQLRAAGWIPAGVRIDEGDRRRYEWRDREGRRCLLRPYATYQWEAKRHLLPHERAAARQADVERRQRYESDREFARRRRDLQSDIEGMPASLADYRREVLEMADTFLRAIERVASDFWDGCHVDEDSADELRAAIATIRATLAGATYHYTAKHRERLRAELQRLDAKGDEGLQRFLARIAPRRPS
jgi:hypothetical protein